MEFARLRAGPRGNACIRALCGTLISEEVGPIADADPITEAVRLAERASHRPVFMPASPTVLLATLGPTSTRPTATHCVSWLSPSVVVNERPIELYVWLPPTSAHSDGWAVSTPDVFLLAHTDPTSLAQRCPAGRLLQLTAPANAAISLREHIDDAPDRLSRRISDSATTHLLPLAWLSWYRLTGLFDVDSRGTTTRREGALPRTLDVQFDGAEHGIPGLPNDVVNWPGDDERPGTPSYLLLPVRARLVHNGFAELTRVLPSLEPGTRIMEIKMRRPRAIDVPATLERLAPLPMIGRLRDLAGYDILVSEQDFGKAVVSKVWRYARDGNLRIDKLNGDTLADLL
jgi:hypothetical protein